MPDRPVANRFVERLKALLCPDDDERILRAALPGQIVTGLNEHPAHAVPAFLFATIRSPTIPRPSLTATQTNPLSLGEDNSQPVTIMGVDSPALLWLLRGHAVQQVAALDPTGTPPLIITPPMNNLNLPATYRGQDFTWRQTVQCDSLQRGEWWRWLVNRQLPRQDEVIILWARDDLFPDARQTTSQ